MTACPYALRPESLLAHMRHSTPWRPRSIRHLATARRRLGRTAADAALLASWRLCCQPAQADHLYPGGGRRLPPLFNWAHQLQGWYSPEQQAARALGADATGPAMDAWQALALVARLAPTTRRWRQRLAFARFMFDPVKPYRAHCPADPPQQQAPSAPGSSPGAPGAEGTPT